MNEKDVNSTGVNAVSPNDSSDLEESIDSNSNGDRNGSSSSTNEPVDASSAAAAAATTASDPTRPATSATPSSPPKALPQPSSSFHSLSYAYQTYLQHDQDERNHWDDVCRSYRQYASFAMAQWTNHQYRLHALSETQRQLLPNGLKRDTPEFHDRARLYKEAAIRNQFTLDCILRHAGQAHSQEVDAPSPLPAQFYQQNAAKPPQPHQPQHSSDSQMSKVSSVLKSLARDWSHECKEERDMTYQPLLALVQKHLPILRQGRKDTNSTSAVAASSPPRICVPGAGVGRLALELAALGYTVQGNEFSLYMLLASDFILNGGIATPQTPLKISPWLLESRNVLHPNDPTRAVPIPDVDPYSLLLPERNTNNVESPVSNASAADGKDATDIGGEAIGEKYDSVTNDQIDHDATAADSQTTTESLAAALHQVDFSMAAGEFVSIYSVPREQGKWDAVVACFFLDASPSIVEYLQVIYGMLKGGGLLLNFGPLLWHWSGPAMRPDDHDVHTYQQRYNYLDRKYLTSIDLSWEDIQDVLRNIGFEIVECKTGQPALYTADPRSMMHTTYLCGSFVARKASSSTSGAATASENG